MQSRILPATIFALTLAAQPLIGQATTAPAPASPTAPQGETGARPRGPQPKPVNLKVLPKDIARADLIKIMRGYAGALGVKCNFCHAVNPQTHKLDFPSDAKDDKTIARTMIAMTRTINEQYMSQVHDPDAMPEDKHVTCGTCHRGHSMPEHFVPPPEEHHGPPGEAATDQEPH